MDYKNYTIVASAFEKAAQKWISDTKISWTSAGRQHEYRICPLMVKNKPDYPLTSFPSREEVDYFGIQEAKAWIDAQLIETPPK
jgi:hypothetical protein